MKTIIVFGVFVADLSFFSKQIPLTGQTVIGNNHIIGPGGKGSNQAISAARLGADVQFITKIGKDNYSDMALATFQDSGVKTKYIIQDKTLNTGVAGIFVSETSGENAITIVPLSTKALIDFPCIIYSGIGEGTTLLQNPGSCSFIFQLKFSLIFKISSLEYLGPIYFVGFFKLSSFFSTMTCVTIVTTSRSISISLSLFCNDC